MVVHHIAPDGAELFDLINTYLEPEARTLVRRAFEFARQHHGDDRRRSGELYITHPLTIAYYLAEYQLDAAALAAALLHDIVEDTVVSVAEVEESFGPEVARLVNGLTKFELATDDGAPPWMAQEAARDATLHKLFRVMTGDLRVGIIKLFDRLHNMRTIAATSVETQERKAEETLAILRAACKPPGDVASERTSWKHGRCKSSTQTPMKQSAAGLTSFATNTSVSLPASAPRSPPISPRPACRSSIFCSARRTSTPSTALPA
jgi:hypothetical protein